ncbi:MAG: 50S ribosomal protein L33 [Candidatus Hodarchaeales archaeon]
MAKKRSDKIVAMICQNCKSQNYVTMRNKVNLEGKLILKKYCKVCRKQTEHKETAKLK